MKNNLTINRLLIYLLIVTIVGGPYLLTLNTGFTQLYGFRYLIPLLLGYLVYKKQLIFYKNKLTKLTTFFFVFWLVYGGVMLSVSVDFVSGIKELFSIALGFCVYLIFLNFNELDRKTDRYFVNGWSLVLVVVLIFSFWEIITQKHLDSSLVNTLSKLGVFHDLHRVPIFTFDNPNHFAVYLAFSSCILLYLLLKNRYPQFITILLVSCLTFIILLQSRMGMIAFGMISVIFLFIKFSWFDFGVVSRNNLIVIFSIFTFLFIGIYGFHKPIRVHEDLKNQLLSSKKVETPYADSVLLNSLGEEMDEYSNLKELNSLKVQYSQSIINERTKQVVDDSNIEFVAKQDNVHHSSQNIRISLIKNGLYLLKRSNYLGVGPAGFFNAHNLENDLPFNTRGIKNPHNYPIEIVSQYGVLVFLLFCSILLLIFYYIMVYFKINGFTSSLFFSLSLLTTYVIMSNSNSSFLPLPINWVMFSILIVYTDTRIIKIRKND